MKTNTLISIQDIKDNTQLFNNVESAKIRPSILLAQDTELQDVLGSSLYNFIYDKRTENGEWTGLTSTQETFINDFITPALMYFAVSEFVRSTWAEINNIGVVQNESEYGKPMSGKDHDKYVAYFQDKANFYVARLHKWFCDQTDRSDEIFALYEQSTQNKMPNRNQPNDFGIFIPKY